MKFAKGVFGLRGMHSDCAIRGVQSEMEHVMLKAGNEICIGQVEYELTNDNIFVIIRRKSSV